MYHPWKYKTRPSERGRRNEARKSNAKGQQLAAHTICQAGHMGKAQASQTNITAEDTCVSGYKHKGG
jgi:hypothetical protein